MFKQISAAYVCEMERLETVAGTTLRPGGLAITAEAVAFCRFAKTARILDVGCGLGATVHYLIQCGYDAFGIDLSDEILNRTKKYFPPLPLYQGSGDNLPVRGNTLDGVIMECVFSLLQDREFALTEAYRVLKDGGKLIISDFYNKNPSGVLTKEHYLNMLSEQNFQLELWEDKSQHLAQLLVDCIMKERRPDHLFHCLQDKAEDNRLTNTPEKWHKQGYFLIVAGKSAGVTRGVTRGRGS